tara:strand:- start:237 stop:368 length:132 start_codon:yes stop_codon:yes gene_type:complete
MDGVWVVVAPDQNVRVEKMKPFETKILERELIKRMSYLREIKR